MGVFPQSNPLFTLVEMASGLWVSRTVWAAAHFRIADAVGDAPTPLRDIAAATGIEEGALRRLMNALVSIGLFRAEGEDHFTHNEVTPFLKSDHPLSQRPFIDAVFGGEHYAAWGALGRGLEEGGTAFDAAFGSRVFDWYGRNPDPARAFSEAMQATTRLIETMLLASWEPPPFEVAVDVGGSRGALVAALLQKREGARGILFDLPEIADAVRPSIADPRIEVVGGDFFERVPEADLYLLKMILHDWTDAECETILRTIRAAIRPGGHVAIIETILPGEGGPHPGYLMDINMMVMTGGRERSAADFAALLERTGFRLERVTETPSPMGVVQAVAV